MRFYGNLDTRGRLDSWARLSQLAVVSNLPWLCVGDFNEILSVTEKQGGVQRPSRQIDKFRCCINSCGLMDIGMWALGLHGVCIEMVWVGYEKELIMLLLQ